MGDELLKVGLAVSGAIASKEMIGKLLGPTAEYLGDGARDLVARAAENFGRVLTVACQKRKAQLHEKGQVSPRVFKNVWDEARFAEDAFAAEYFGGLLASSRCADGKDESALPYLNIVGSLPSLCLRLHFIVYSLVARVPQKANAFVGEGAFLKVVISMPCEELFASLASGGTCDEYALAEAVRGLVEAGLLGTRYAIKVGGFQEGEGDLSTQDSSVSVCPSRRGAVLFLKALGFSGQSPQVINSVEVDASLSDIVLHSISLPAGGKWSLRHFHHLTLEKIAEMEATLDGVQSEIQDLRSQVEDEADPG